MNNESKRAAELENETRWQEAATEWARAHMALTEYAMKHSSATHYRSDNGRASIEVNLAWLKRRAARCRYMHDRRPQEVIDFPRSVLSHYAHYPENATISTSEYRRR